MDSTNPAQLLPSCGRRECCCGWASGCSCYLGHKPVAVEGISIAESAAPFIPMKLGKTIWQGLHFAFFLAWTASSIYAQRARGELRLEVRDPQGAALSPMVELVSDASQVRRTFQIAVDGR